jgi:hypothetical protein
MKSEISYNIAALPRMSGEMNLVLASESSWIQRNN